MALTALLVDVFGALGEGDDLVAGEHPGTVGLLTAQGTERLPAGVAEVHGVQLLCEGTQLVAGMALAGDPCPPRLSTPLPSPPWCSTGRSWHTARPPRCRLSCPPGTAGAGPRGAAPCLPSPLRGACRDGMGTRIGTPTRASGTALGMQGAVLCSQSRRAPDRAVPYPQSGQRRRPSLARPRRQLAQKLW